MTFFLLVNFFSKFWVPFSTQKKYGYGTRLIEIIDKSINESLYRYITSKQYQLDRKVDRARLRQGSDFPGSNLRNQNLNLLIFFSYFVVPVLEYYDGVHVERIFGFYIDRPGTLGEICPGLHFLPG